MDYTKNTAIKTYIKALEECHTQTRLTTNNPEDTIKAFQDKVGLIGCAETVACMIQHYSWDGRISQKNIDWANEWIFPEKMVENADTGKIHMCHIDQLASILRRREA